jgi:hypothetical protein
MLTLLCLFGIAVGVGKLTKTAARHPDQSMALAKWIRGLFGR